MSNLFDSRLKHMFGMKIKETFWGFIKFLCLIHYPIGRLFFGKKGKTPILNLACGPRYYAPWLNVDGNPFRKKDVWMDLTNPWPIPNNSCEGIVASHVFEHIYEEDFGFVLEQCFRVLKPGGFLTVATPSIDYEIRKYMNQENKLVAGKDFSSCMFYHGAHKQGFNFSIMSEKLKSAGFTAIDDHSYADKTEKLSTDTVSTIIHHPSESLIVECVKPESPTY